MGHNFFMQMASHLLSSLKCLKSSLAGELVFADKRGNFRMLGGPLTTKHNGDHWEIQQNVLFLKVR